MKIVAKQKEFVGGVNYLPVGTHEVSIASIEDAVTNPPTVDDINADGDVVKVPLWNDVASQIKVTFDAIEGDGKHIEWYNTKGYKRYSELTEGQKKSNAYASRSFAGSSEDYAILKSTNMRIEDEERTAKCLEIIGELAYICGAESGEELEVKDLEGALLSLTLKANAQGKTRMHYVNKITA